MRALSSLVVLLSLAGCSSGYVAAPTQVRTTAVDTSSDPYFAAPWPDDRRLLSDGTLGTMDFPNPGAGPLFDMLEERSDGLVRGWGLAAPIFLPFTGSLDPASLPANPSAATAADASIFLVAIDPASAVYARPVPLEWKLFDAPTLFLPGHVLAVRPVVGFPLEPKTRYALVVTTRVHDAAGVAVGAQEPFFLALAADDAASAVERAHLEPLARYLSAQGLAPESVAGATIFTTQAIVEELLLLRDALLDGPAPTSSDLAFVKKYPGFTDFAGTYEAPYFLHGTAPYETKGGEFQFDADGLPIASKRERLRLTACVPHGPVPQHGFPAVFYSHGTGADFHAIVDDRTCEALAAAGLAGFGIDQVLHGPRAGAATTCFGQDVENCFFNVVNAPAGRNLLRQSALDHVSLRRLVEGLVLPASADPDGRTVRFDVRQAGFFGHSQGGLTGALYAAISPDLGGALLSGAGGHLSTSMLLRDNGEIKTLIEGFLFLNIVGKEELEQFHPALALIQTLAEAADPASYARYWSRRPHGQAKSVFLTSGLDDPYTPASSAEALAVAGVLPQLRGGETDSAAFRLAGLLPVDAPVRANLGPSVTGVFRQFPAQGHFPIFNDPTARRQLAEWFRTLAADGVPTVVAP